MPDILHRDEFEHQSLGHYTGTVSAIVGLDLGTTGIRAIAFSESGSILAQAYEEVPLIFPKAGWVEQDPIVIRDMAIRVLRKVVNELGAKNVRGIGITNQRETTILWNKTTGRPIYNAVVWQCRRTAKLCRERSDQADFIFNKTGLRLDPYFSATKIEWIFQNVPSAKQLADSGNLAFGTVDTWVLWHLTARQVHATDASNASRTMLVDISTGQYDPALLRLFAVPNAILPEILNSNAHFGSTDTEICGFHVPILAILGDQQAALFAHGQFEFGTVKNTYGTGLFVVGNTGDTRLNDANLVSTVAWQIDGKLTYATEGSIFTGGAAIQWLRDGLGIIQDASETAELAAALPDNGGVYFVPALSGLGAPYWDADARGTIVGLTRGSDRRHIVRAALEGLAHQTADIIDILNAQATLPISTLRVDGGAVANSFLMQFQADMLDMPIVKTKLNETTALGVAMLAGLSAGFWTQDQLKTLNPVTETIHPKMNAALRKVLRNEWHHAIKQAQA